MDREHLLVEAIIRRGDSPHTRRAYALDLRTYRAWLESIGLAWDRVSSDDLDDYREWLASRYARSTTNRRLSVVRVFYAEAKRRHLIVDDPGERLRGLRGRDDRDGGVLTRSEARQLMESIRADLRQPHRRLRAYRDQAIIALLLRTGLRRAELTSIRVADMTMAQGHHVLTVSAKGNVLRTVKVPTEVHRMLESWLMAARSAYVELDDDDPLFVRVDRAHGCKPLGDGSIYDIVMHRTKRAGLAETGPHGLRATFVTLALEGGAPLHLVQRAVGHADPRTTERYWRRKDALDDNAVDYVKL